MIKYVAAIIAMFLIISSVAFADEEIPWREKGLKSRTLLDWQPGDVRTENTIWELPLDLKKLSEQCKSGVTAETVALVAETGNGFEPVPFSAHEALDRFNLNACVLRFTMPASSKSLYLYFNGIPAKSEKSPATFDGEWNILKSIFDNAAGWQKSHQAIPLEIAESGGNRVLNMKMDEAHIKQFTLGSWDTIQVYKDIPVPEQYRGQDVFCSIDMKLLSAEQYLPVSVSFKQLDDKGAEVAGSAIDQRWLTLTLAIGQDVKLREPGRLSPGVRKLRVGLLMRPFQGREGSYDTVSGWTQTTPKNDEFTLQISKLELRVAQRIALPGREASLYGAGVSGAAGDRSLILDGDTCLRFDANPQVVWSESRAPKDPSAYHWPFGSGTVEFWYCPDWTKKNVQQDPVACLFEAKGRAANSINLKISYDLPAKQFQLEGKDAAGKPFKSTKTLELIPLQWHHFAYCWNAENGRRELFLDGKSIIKLSEPFKGVDVENPCGLLPCNIALGASDNLVKGSRAKQFCGGRVDEFMVSDLPKYNENFTPSKQRFSKDIHTRALFHFDLCKDGEHYGEDEAIKGCLWTVRSPWCSNIVIETMNGTQKSDQLVAWYPAKCKDSDNPAKILPIDSYTEVLDAKRFAASYVPVSQKFQLAAGGTKNIFCKTRPFMNYVDIACPANGEPLLAPLLYAEGDVDPRTMESIGESLKLKELSSEKEKVNALFRFLVASTDYFMSYPVELYPTGTIKCPGDNPLAHLNSYLQFECGYLNNTTRTIFVKNGFSANVTHGSGHMFEQVLFDNQWHLYDLMPRKFFPARDNTRAACLSEVEEDPFLVARLNDNSAELYLPTGLRGIDLGGRTEPRPAIFYRLNPGESFRYYWYNSGIFNGLSSNGYEKAAPWQSGLKNGALYRIEDHFPSHLANGVFTYQGKPLKDHGSFPKWEKDSFCYEAYSPYVITDAWFQLDVAAVPAAGIFVDISYDVGKTWKRLTMLNGDDCRKPFRLDLNAKGRFSYWLKFGIAGTQVSNFVNKTMVQINPRILTPLLKAGENKLTLKALKGKADITISCREESAPLELAGGISWGFIPGIEKQLFVCRPKEKLVIPLKGCDNTVAVKSSLALRTGIVNRDNAPALEIEAGNTEDLYEITVACGGREKRAILLVCANSNFFAVDKAVLKNGAILGDDPEKLARKVVVLEPVGASAVFKGQPYPQGKYAIFVLAKRGSDKRGSLSLVVSGEPRRITSSSNMVYEYYCQVHLQSRWQWDHPLQGKYPFEYLLPMELPAGDSLEVKLMRTSVSCAGMLALPADKEKLISKILKYLFSKNNDPWIFEGNW